MPNMCIIMLQFKERMVLKMNNYQIKSPIRLKNTPSAEAVNNLFYIQEIGYLPAECAGHTYRKQFDSYFIMLILKGEGILKYNGGKYMIYEGQGSFIDCRREHSYICDPEKPWEVIWMHFNGPCAEYYYKKFLKTNSCLFLPKNMNDFTAVMYEAIANNSHKDRITELINAKLITDILTMIILNPVAHGLNDSYSYQMKSVREYLDSHFTECINLDNISEAFYINKYHLTREFKKEYGETIFQHIIKKRIEYAKELLASTDKTIEEISLLSGFNDQSYFSRQFKKITGVSSLQYRKSNKPEKS